MLRLRPLTKDEVPDAIRPMLEQAERAFGVPSASAGIQAYCPPVLEASRAIGGAPARSGKLPPGLRSLAMLRVAQMVGCPF
ncbi:MAG: carboxymuconolactone decarboxylase family protein [Chloroflexota bacterium]|nr:carboxymuconolactone decarboxylase family protein [Chloroflexota bacterium]MDE3193194.1 carboxymuconolactone decarboxylase family protein [Chloroflexota bacterium]